MLADIMIFFNLNKNLVKSTNSDSVDWRHESIVTGKHIEALLKFLPTFFPEIIHGNDKNIHGSDKFLNSGEISRNYP